MLSSEKTFAFNLPIKNELVMLYNDTCQRHGKH
jgi:hypothetical protein